MTLSISGGSRFVALVGDPVRQARSIAMLNAHLDQLPKALAFMMPWHVTKGDLGRAIEGARGLTNMLGGLVTMPHKKSVLPLMDTLSEDALAIGAVNIFRRNPDGTLHGGNLDGAGFVRGLRKAGHEIAGKSCYLAGAGGAAAAIAHAVSRAGCRNLFVGNRTESQAGALLMDLRHRWPNVRFQRGWNSVEPLDLAINATPVGMVPGSPLSIPEDVVRAARVVADIIVDPPMTPLLKLAESLGKAIHFGAPMFEAQIEEAATFWTL